MNRSARAPKGPLKSARASADVLIIGAGAVGAACAAELARRGRRVRVLSNPSRSTTAVSGGHLLLQSKRPGPLLDLARRSLALVAEAARGREDDLGYRQTGSLILALPEEEPQLRMHFEALRASGVPVEWLDGDAARALEPHVSPAVSAAACCPVDAQVDPRALAAVWLHEAIAHGASVTSGALVESFVLSRGAVVGVVASGVDYPAAAVIIAAGPWSGELAAMAGAKVEIVPRRGVLLRAHVARVLASRPLLGASYLQAKFSDEPHGVAFSFQQHPGGECVLGGAREFAGFSPAGIEALEGPVVECGARYLPAAAEIAWGQAEAGFRPWTPDGLPRIGACEVPGLFLACGHEGDGITLAAGTAKLVADAVEAQPQPNASRS